MCVCVQFTEGCCQRHRVQPLPRQILMLFLFVFIWFPEPANVTHRSIRDVTMFSMLFFFLFVFCFLEKEFIE